MLEIEDEHPDKLLHRGVTKAIIGAAFDVHSELGHGFLERVYQRALQVELSRRGLSAEIERRVQVRYKGVVVGDYDADLIVAGSVLSRSKLIRNTINAMRPNCSTN
jgi:GxxExxY protein